ncbi:MAG TPA: aldehyde dehydrogenase family protein, partial [Myxococcota bacterium]|nr:aldehyde dehydrogenase family protein [Myxococcota bacterium]
MQSQLWINGAARPAANGQSFTTPNPTTGQVLAELPRATQADVEEAIAGAKRGFEAWQRVDVHERARILWRIGDGMLARLEELARLETLDTGKPLANSRAIDIPRAAETFHYFAGWADKIMGETVPVRGPYLNYTLREPLGIVAAITPWNFPILLAARKVAPALACGNAVILKPAEQSSLTSLALGPICKEAGVPDGLVQVLSGFGPEVGAALVDHPEIAKITFTGGTDTGRRIMRAAAGSLKKLSLELGGKSPNIIFADADLPAAARAAARAIFYNQGEICTAGSRLLVEESVKDQVLEHLLIGEIFQMDHIL